jgi:hypothetical protein
MRNAKQLVCYRRKLERQRMRRKAKKARIARHAVHIRVRGGFSRGSGMVSMPPKDGLFEMVMALMMASRMRRKNP